MRKTSWIIGALAMGLVAACGDTYLERGASGALIGAGAAAATDNDPLLGATLGGAAGVITTR